MAMHTWFECKIRYEKTMENGDDSIYNRRIYSIGH